MSTATIAENAPAPDRWGGGVDPYGMSWQKQMLWWFIVNDALLFGAFLASYGFNRLAADAWPDRTKMFSLEFITVMTFILITSSATMATAVAASQKGDEKTTTRFLLLTLLGGLAFIGCQVVEWWELISHGASPGVNPWGTPGFTSSFFLITGFHGLHVLIGLIAIAVTLFASLRGRVTAQGVELAGLYWHFVDLVWVFIFGCFYLI